MSCHDSEHSESLIICVKGSLNHKAMNFFNVYLLIQ